jgi:vacuolar protein sorting-associated protein 54
MPMAESGVNDYMELLVKETVTLHKVLSRYLPIPVLEVDIFSHARPGACLILFGHSMS